MRLPFEIKTSIQKLSAPFVLAAALFAGNAQAQSSYQNPASYENPNLPGIFNPTYQDTLRLVSKRMGPAVEKSVGYLLRDVQNFTKELPKNGYVSCVLESSSAQGFPPAKAYLLYAAKFVKSLKETYPTQWNNAIAELSTWPDDRKFTAPFMDAIISPRPLASACSANAAASRPVAPV